MLTKIFREFKQAWYWYWVPFVATPDDKLQIILENIELKKREVFVDIGCWDGKVLEAVAEKFPGVKCIWYESSSYPYSLAQKRLKNSQKNFEVCNISIFSVSLKDADSIYIYMLPYMLQKLTKKIQSECKVWTKIYIKTHQIKSWLPEKVVPLSKNNNFYIYSLK